MSGRVGLRAVSGDIIPRHGSVTRGQTKVIDPAAHVITRAWTAANGGTRIPRLTADYDGVKKDVERAESTNSEDLPRLKRKLTAHECPATFCTRFNPDNAEPWEEEAAGQLCQRTPGTEGERGGGNYRSAALPWQKAVAEYTWGSRRSMLLEAGTGTGKTVVAAYCLQLMAFIDKGQGGFFGKDSRNTNIAVLVCADQSAGGADTLKDKVLRTMAERVAPTDMQKLEGITPQVGAKGGHPIVQVLSPLMAKLRQKAFDEKAPGRLFFGLYPENASEVFKGGRNGKEWGWLVASVQNKFLILDEVQAAPLLLFLAVAEARERSSTAHAANSATEISSPTVLMMSATPCAGGILHFANMLLCLDNDDSGAKLGQAVAWPVIANKTASDHVLHRKKTGSPNVLPLLREMGLTIRSIVQVGDTVVLAGSAPDVKFTVVVKIWDKASGLELVELDRINETIKDDQALWWPALMCLVADESALAGEVTLWYSKQATVDRRHSLAITESIKGAPGKKPMAGEYVECSRCDIVSVAGPETMWAHTSLQAVALAIVWDLAGSDYSPILDKVLRRMEAMVPESRERSMKQMRSVMASVEHTLPQDLRQQVAKKANKCIGNPPPPEPGFVPATEEYFLGHAAFAELDKTHLFPTPKFDIVDAPEIPPLENWDAKATRFLERHYADADIGAVARHATYQGLAERLWGTSKNATWKLLNETVAPGMDSKESGIGGLTNYEYFNKSVRPWMPMALCLVFSAIYAARKRGLPALYYCFLTPDGTDLRQSNKSYESSKEMSGRAAMFHVYGNTKMFTDVQKNPWTKHLRAAIVVAQRVLLPLAAFHEAVGSMIEILPVFFPKMMPFSGTNAQRSVLYTAAPMRFVAYAYAVAVAEYETTVHLVDTPGEDGTYYMDQARKGAEGFAKLAFNEELDNVTDLEYLRVDNLAIQAVHEGLRAKWKAALKLSEGPSSVIICDLAGAVGHDFPDYQLLGITAPPRDQDMLTQLLGRIRRFQGLCNTNIDPRVVHYLVVCDANGSDTRDLSSFKSLAKPVSASQLHASKATSSSGKLTTPMTAWDVIKSAVARGPQATDEVGSFAALDFASRGLKSKDCVAYLKLTLATYNWKNVVDSSAHDFGVIGPRDLDLGVAGDAVYFECLAEALDDDFHRCIHNVFKLQNLNVSGNGRGTFLPPRGASHYLSVRVLDYDGSVNRIAVSDAALQENTGLIQSTPLLGYVMLNQGEAPQTDWPKADEGTLVKQVLQGDLDMVRELGWEPDAHAAIRWLYEILHVLGHGTSSSLMEDNDDDVDNVDRNVRRCGRLTNEGQSFHSQLETVNQSHFLPSVQLVNTGASTDPDTVLHRLEQVATGKRDPQSIWFWPCVRALEASVVAKALYNAIETVELKNPGTEREANMLALVVEIVSHASTALHKLSIPHFEEWQVVPTSAAYLRGDVGERMPDFLRALAPIGNANDGNRKEPTDPDQEREARQKVVRAMWNGPVECTVWAAATRAIWLPCRAELENSENDMAVDEEEEDGGQAADSEDSESEDDMAVDEEEEDGGQAADSEDSESEDMDVDEEEEDGGQAAVTQSREDSNHLTAEEVEHLKSQMRHPSQPGALRELAIGHDVFKAALVGLNADTWSAKHDSWIRSILDSIHKADDDEQPHQPSHVLPLKSNPGPPPA
jgi:hypothetical protein